MPTYLANDRFGGIAANPWSGKVGRIADCASERGMHAPSTSSRRLNRRKADPQTKCFSDLCYRGKIGVSVAGQSFVEALSAHSGVAPPAC